MEKNTPGATSDEEIHAMNGPKILTCTWIVTVIGMSKYMAKPNLNA